MAVVGAGAIGTVVNVGILSAKAYGPASAGRVQHGKAAVGIRSGIDQRMVGAIAVVGVDTRAEDPR